ncbi:LytR/AlgR family response regulator transcription factor [Mucilaginibacter auburnensis]|uniref:Two-component system LytT family response regulator n=1 Tax=Mucilaginibacter auburnensis TaxID=1457233 RepID=A0A2H9VPJ6_9SPHI|nr:LytTR family DNA-binding domain-containing protein [Mucilaginibacter auburnensis]PJJ80247.1 two-component system LytT family response regulator [Mucilaginibacter auburnensis]
MKALIIDDEVHNIDNLQILLSQYCPDVEIAGTATAIEKAVALVDACTPDIVFLDIQLGGSTGFDFLKLLPKKEFEVIFITAYDKYGLDAIKFAAIDYLLKPVAIADLIIAVNKAREKLKLKEKSKQLDFLLSHVRNSGQELPRIALPQLHEIRYVLVNEIVRCEADNSYTFFYLTNRERILVSRSIKEYTDLLRSSGFIRTHQSHLINSIHIKSWVKEDGGLLVLTNGDKIPVSKPNRDAVKSSLNRSLR